MEPVEILEASLGDKSVVGRLLELYQYDFSEFVDGDLDAHGVYGYQFLDNYWTEPERHPFLFRVGGKWAGFALVRAGAPHDMAEFFVMRKYRRHGVGIVAARELFARFPGDWQVRQMATNAPATSFWRRAIPYPFEEERNDRGTVQCFAVPDR
jgi:predicted acetyltransferase